MEDLEELQPQKKTIEMERWNISDLKDYISKPVSYTHLTLPTSDLV